MLTAAKFDGFVVVICFGSVPCDKTKGIINSLPPPLLLLQGTFYGLEIMQNEMGYRWGQLEHSVAEALPEWCAEHAWLSLHTELITG